jgi:hypothetical protein
MFVVAIAPAVLTGLLFLTAPNWSVGMRTPEPFPLGTIVVGAGILAYVVGLALMIRIYRADPEASRSYWRFRNH